MPQTRRLVTRQSSEASKAAGKTITALKSKQENNVQAKKRPLSTVNGQKAPKRAAFEDITNDVGPEKQSLKNQMKKGLSNFVGLRGKSTNAGEATKQAKRFKLAPSQKEVSKEDEAGFDLAVEQSQSLPSSQEDNESKESREISTEETHEEESEYESADENKENIAPPKVDSYVAPPRPVPPTGVTDFDLENWKDPLQCSEYVMEIFQYYKSREEQFRVPDYMASQPEINNSMRAILIDWLVEVQESFELNHETLYTAVKMMDIFLSRRKISREDLQLVGATCCLIASKIDERIPPLLEDFAYVCDGAYSHRQITAMEREIVAAVGFDFGYPLTYRFLRRYARVCKMTMPVLTFARYILETALLEYNLNVETSESRLAAATLALALKVKGISGWAPTLKYYSGYSVSEISDLVSDLSQMLRQPAKDNLKTIRQKYSHKVFHEVALTEIPDDIHISDNE